jgi:hypothetical protein
MIREEISSSGSGTPTSSLGVYLLFGIVTLFVGGGLMAVRHYTVSRTAAAQSWTATPCVIQRSGFETGDEGERYLDIQYSYEFNGQQYESYAIDLLPGSAGDESAFEEQLYEACPVGATVTCYVNPEDPSDAVLDREHGIEGIGVLRMLAFPFLVISACFLYAAASTVMASSRVSESASQLVQWLGDPPRRLSPVAALAVLFTTPKQVKLAWAFRWCSR